MHYLKCNNCGHLNEVKGEYLIFCSGCDKKLENNFTDWKKRNHDKTLNDFKQLMCVSETDVRPTPSKKKSKIKIRGLKYWIIFSIVFAIFYAIGQFGAEEIIQLIKSETTSREVLSNEWIKDTYGSYGLTVETPVKMTKGDLPVPDNVIHIIDQMDVYNYTSNKGFKVMINSVKYNPSVGQTNLQGSADGLVNEIKMQKGVTDFDYTEEYVYKEDIPGFVQKGTYKHKGIEVEFINTGFSKGLVLWQVIVVYQVNDEVGRIAAKRVIDSIEIKENTLSQNKI